MIKWSRDFMGREFLIVSHHPAQFDNHKHFGSGGLISIVYSLFISGFARQRDQRVTWLYR